jgi:ribonuclease HII
VTLGNLALESYFFKRGTRFLAGVDEAGRGPLAGPVVACACLVLPHVQIPGVRDSKQLSPKVRKNFFWEIISKTLVGVGIVGEQEIDRINILNASLLAMRHAVLALTVTPEILLIDGNRTINLPIDQIPVVRGDDQLFSVAAASIVAKVTRDEIMMNLSKKYPQYGFEKHKGYPTKAHVEALNEFGPSSIHRMSFGPVERSAAAVSL